MSKQFVAFLLLVSCAFAGVPVALAFGQAAGLATCWIIICIAYLYAAKVLGLWKKKSVCYGFVVKESPLGGELVNVDEVVSEDQKESTR